MDPVSLAASIITITGVGGTVGKALRRVVALKNAPDILLALNNEIADLRLVMQDVSDLLQTQANCVEEPPTRSVYTALKNIRSNVARLEHIVAYELTAVKGKGNEATLDRSVWLRIENKVRILKEDIRDDKRNLSSALSILTASLSLKVVSRIQQRSLVVEDSGGRLPMTPLTLDYTQLDGQVESDMNIEAPSPGKITSIRQPIAPDVEYSKILGIGISRRSCALDRCCVCHNQSHFRSPSFLDQALGSLFLGYKASPSTRSPCDSSRCSNRSTTIIYTFPRWFWDRIVTIKVSCANSLGPELLLRVTRLRSNDDIVFDAIYWDDNAPLLQRLLVEGEASVLDVDQDSDTLLSIATKKQFIEMAELLICAGADLFQEDRFGWSPYTNVWTAFLTVPNCYNEEDSKRLGKILDDQSHLDVFGFPPLLRAYLVFYRRTFDEELSMTSSANIDSEDAQGRTTLSWAAQRGDSTITKLLLDRGASPNKVDHEGSSPLYYSVWADSELGLQYLLAAGAQIDGTNNYGATALSMACNFGQADHMKALISHGARINHKSNYGNTALCLGILGDHTRIVKYLLDGGADYTNVNGRQQSDLCVAIQFNSHHVLKALVIDSIENSRYDRFSPDILSCAAALGDINTLSILSSAPDLTHMEEEISEAWERAKFRRDWNEKWARKWCRNPDEDPEAWYAAFDYMMEITKSGPRAVEIDEESDGVEYEQSDTDYNEQYNGGSDCEDGGQEIWEDAPESPGLALGDNDATTVRD